MWAFKWSGKASRADWWSVWFVSALIVDVAVIAAVFSQIYYLATPNWPFLASIFVALLAAWPAYAVTAQRFRDRGESPWLTLLHFVPVLGWGWLIVACGVLPNTNYEVVTTKVAQAGRREGE